MNYQNYQKNPQISQQTTLKEFEIISILGEGSFSQVFKVKRKSNLQIYAMKKVKMNQLKPKEKENALNEVRILASINSKNIINYKEAFVDEYSQVLCIVLEFAEGGDLQAKINQHIKSKTHFSEPQIWQMLIDMTKGLKILHDMNILHRDLKSANIFVSKQNTYKLGDLNVSIVAKNGFVMTQTGTPYYASPEVWRDEPYGIKSDIWSLGCVLYEACAQRPPFVANDMEGLFNKIQEGRYERISYRYSDELSDIISSMLQTNPQIRPNCFQILSNRFVKKYTKEEFKENNQFILKQELLQTIQLPKNLGLLRGKLPKAQYDDDIKQQQYTPQQQYKRPNRQIVSAGEKRIQCNLIFKNVNQQQPQINQQQPQKMNQQQYSNIAKYAIKRQLSNVVQGSYANKMQQQPSDYNKSPIQNIPMPNGNLPTQGQQKNEVEQQQKVKQTIFNSNNANKVSTQRFPQINLKANIQQINSKINDNQDYTLDGNNMIVNNNINIYLNKQACNNNQSQINNLINKQEQLIYQEKIQRIKSSNLYKVNLDAQQMHYRPQNKYIINNQANKNIVSPQIDKNIPVANNIYKNNVINMNNYKQIHNNNNNQLINEKKDKQFIQNYQLNKQRLYSANALIDNKYQLDCQPSYKQIMNKYKI